VGIKRASARVSLPRVFDAYPYWRADLRAGNISHRVTQGSPKDATAVDLDYCGDERNGDARIAATDY
jgi:hypothetical protein